MLLFAPVIVAAGALTGWAAHGVLARLHPTVRLAERVAAEERGEYTDTTLESDAFRESKQTYEQLYGEARAVRGDFAGKSAWLGAFLGLVVSWHLVSLSVVRKRTDYETNRAFCVSCARCFPYCPVEKENDAIKQKEA